MRCEICDTEIPAGATECPHCGFEVEWMQAWKSAQAYADDKRPGIDTGSDSRYRTPAKTGKTARRIPATAGPRREEHRHAGATGSTVIKILLVLVCLVTIVCAGLLVCLWTQRSTSFVEEEQKTESFSKQSDKKTDTANASAQDMSIKENERVIMYHDDVQVFLTGIDYTPEYQNLSLDVTLENMSSRTVDLYCDSASVNDWTVTGSGIEHTPPGKKQASHLTLFLEGTDILALDDIEQIQIELIMWDADTFEDIGSVTSVSLDADMIQAFGHDASFRSAAGPTPIPTTGPNPTAEPTPTVEPTPTSEPAPTAEPVPTKAPAPRVDNGTFSFTGESFQKLLLANLPSAYATGNGKQGGTLHIVTAYDSDHDTFLSHTLPSCEGTTVTSASAKIDSMITGFATNDFSTIIEAIIKVCDPSLSPEARTGLMESLGLNGDTGMSNLSGEGVEAKVEVNGVWYAIIKTPGYTWGDWLFQVSVKGEPDGSLPDGSGFWVHSDGIVTGGVHPF